MTHHHNYVSISTVQNGLGGFTVTYECRDLDDEHLGCGDVYEDDLD